MQTRAHLHGRSTNKSFFIEKHHLLLYPALLKSSSALFSGGWVPERPIRTPAGIQLMIEVRERTCTREKDGFFLSLLSLMMCSCAMTCWCRARGGHVCLIQCGNIRRRRGPRRLPGSRTVINTWNQQHRGPWVASSSPVMLCLVSRAHLRPHAHTHRHAVTYSCLLCNDPQCSDPFSHWNNPPLSPLTTLFTRPKKTKKKQKKHTTRHL